MDGRLVNKGAPEQIPSFGRAHGSVSMMLTCTINIYSPGKAVRWAHTKTVGFCSIDVLDSKYDFGISAPPGEK